VSSLFGGLLGGGEVRGTRGGGELGTSSSGGRALVDLLQERAELLLHGRLQVLAFALHHVHPHIAQALSEHLFCKMAHVALFVLKTREQRLDEYREVGGGLWFECCEVLKRPL
jgi:hypothetical protein